MGENQISPLLAPSKKMFGKIIYWPPQEKNLRRPWMNLWVVEQQVKMDVSIWDAVHSHSMGVSAEWSRCLSSMSWRARDSVASLRRSSVGWMPARIQRLFTGVRCRHPVTIRKASLIAGQWGRCEHCGTRQGAQYSAVESTRVRWLFSKLLLQHPSQAPQECNTWCQLFTKWLRCQRYVTVLSNIPLRYVGSEQKGRVLLFWLTFSSCLSFLLLRWRLQHCFYSNELNLHFCRYSPTVAMSLLCTSSTVCQCLSACMIARSLPYAYCITYFLENVAGMSEIQMLKKRGARMIPMVPFWRRNICRCRCNGEAAITNQVHDEADHAPVR